MTVRSSTSLRQNPAYRPRGPLPIFIMRRSVVLPAGIPILALSWGLVSCRAAVPRQVLSQPAQTAPALSVTGVRGPWIRHASALRQSYVLDQRAEIRFSQDSLVRLDSVSSHSEITFATIPQTVRITGVLQVFRVLGPSREYKEPSGLRLPFAFSAEFPSGAWQVDFAPLSAPLSAPDLCAGSELAVVQSLRDLWFQVPDTLRLGLQWHDSASYPLCRDGIPLHFSVRRDFRITRAAEEEGRHVLSVERVSGSSVAAEVVQSGRRVTVTGVGTGTFSYALDPRSGEIISARGSTILNLLLDNGLRVQRVQQVSEIRIARGS